MELQTERLILRRWKESDAPSLFKYASNPEIGPIAGWPPHKNIQESIDVIRNVLNGPECYAICEKDKDEAIGAIELRLAGNADLTNREDESELGYWIGRPFWGRGYMPEAARELIRHGFEDLNMSTIWCGYYDGNTKSKRVQEKVGFIFHHTSNEVEVPLLNEVRIGHANYLTRERWDIMQKCIFCHKVWLSTDIVYEDSSVMAFYDMNPINEGHILLVPKNHYLDADELPDELLSHLMLVSKKLIAEMKEKYHPDGYSIMQNGGIFNDIGHYHLHIFPRYKDDGFGWTE